MTAWSAGMQTNDLKQKRNMEKEKTERAAIELCTTEGQEEWVKDYGVSCFKDGARWRINEAWHDMKERPKHKQQFVYQALRKSGEIYYGLTQTFGDDEWDFLNKCAIVERWAYLNDLLPDTRKEAER